MSEINWAALAAPFPATEIEWRIAQAGKNGQGQIWAKVLAYVTSRAIQHRLDDVLTPAGWRNEYMVGPQGGVLCGISIRIPLASGVDTITKAAVFHGSYEWVTKYDGADNTDIEAVKGGLSDAMKRAAVQWGIGRYLYDLEEGWAEVIDGKKPGSRYANCKIKVGGKEEYASFNWLPPKLPDWALPAAGVKPKDTPPKASTKERDAFNEFVLPLIKEGRITRDNVQAELAKRDNDYKATRTFLESLTVEGAKA